MYETKTITSDLNGMVATSGYLQVLPKNSNVCPHCGRCPHCGQPTPSPYTPYYPNTTIPYTLTGGVTQSQQGGISGPITGVASFNAQSAHGGNVGHGG